MTNPTSRPLPPVLDECWNVPGPTAWPGTVPARAQSTLR